MIRACLGIRLSKFTVKTLLLNPWDKVILLLGACQNTQTETLVVTFTPISRPKNYNCDYPE